MNRELDQDPDHHILAEAWRYEIVGLRLERAPDDGREPHLDLSLKYANKRRILRFWSPADIEIERGGPCMTSGLTIKDLRARGLHNVGVKVDDFEGTVGAVRFVARAVEGLGVTRWLRWYQLEGDSLVGEALVTGASLTDLQALFGVSDDNPLYDCYPVETQHARCLQDFVTEPIDLTRFAYFLEATAIDARG